MRSPASSVDRAGRPFDLLSLARALTAASEHALVWKGAGSLDSAGDLDCAVPRRAWPAVEDAFHAWATDEGMAATVVCTHAVGVHVLVGCAGGAGSDLLQVDLVDAKLVHGVPVWTADDLHGVAVVEGGVRRLPAGAEGVARLLAHRRDVRGRELLDEDATAGALAGVLGARGRLALRRGSTARLALELVLAGRALAAPRSLARSVATDRARRGCLVLRALGADRRVPEPVEAWLAAAEADHEVTRA
jgi:hypothetical protein